MTPPRRLILFRFHHRFAVARERVRLLRAMNPGTPIVGLFGGLPQRAEEARRAISDWTDGFDTGVDGSQRWKWLHADLMIREWFQRRGHTLPFDVLYDHEWDLLLARPLAQLHAGAHARTVALTGLEPLSKVGSWWDWTTGPNRPHFERFAGFLQRTYGVAPRWASHGPGCVFGRAFLEALATAALPQEVVEPLISELTLPALAEALGFAVESTGLQPTWATSDGREAGLRVFNCEDCPIFVRTILAELGEPNGHRAFHPVRVAIMLEDLLPWARGQLLPPP